MLQRVNEEELRCDFTNGSLEGLQTDDELTSHLAGHTVQCGVDQTKNPTVNRPHLIHSTRRRVDIWATINTDSTSLVSFSFSFPFQTGLSARKNAKIADSNHKLSFHSRRIPANTGQPFTVTWKVVIVEKMLFEDSLVCHDTPSARISPSNDSLPPPCRSTAGMRAQRALLPGRSSKPCTVDVQRADFGNYVSRPGQVAASSKQDARDTVKWLNMPDVHGDRSTTTAEHVQHWRRRRSFSFLHLVVVASSLLALTSGSLLLSERMTVLVSFFQAVTDRCAPAFGAFFYWFSV